MVVIYFFHTKYANTCFHYYGTCTTGLLLKGSQLANKTIQSTNVHSKQSSSTLRVDGGSGDLDTSDRWIPQRVQRVPQEARVVALGFTVKVVVWMEK